MPSDIPNATTKPRQQNTSKYSSWLTIPKPLAILFRKFPLLTYPPNELPARSPNVRDVATLYVFISDQDALNGLPSFNPSCLKWQAFLKIAGIDFRVVPSTNHASPTGALPFLIPPSSPRSPTPPAPIPSSKLEQYAAEEGTVETRDVLSLKLEAYESLLDYRIRNAWLYSLYISRSNSTLLSQLYVEPASSSQVVRTTVLYQLRQAAEAEILSSIGAPAVHARALYKGAGEAFGALSTALGSDVWFFGASQPGLFDASVFAYTHLLLDQRLAWVDRTLTEMVEGFPNLIEHRDRILWKF
ncbi:hypothetical protein F4804DRAFT_306994 [Jackrogersella minutella]|nr:hypothetical protein F4804DRAFT_306994 [Jackrogersella minutella]